MKKISETHIKLGKRIKELRQGLDMTQEDVAFEVGVDRSYMGFIERGEKNPTLLRLMKIAKILKISLSGLFKSL